MNKFALGLMSGTSADGVSFALCDFRSGFKLIAEKTYSYPRILQKQILRGPQLLAPEISELHFAIGKFYANLCLKFLHTFKIRRSDLSVVGSHGQTIYHGPGGKIPNTLQIGEPSFIANALKIPVVSDFRSRDIAAGGTGAPLIPFFDRNFPCAGKIRAFQNIGGIGNVTVVGARIKSIAFDTGPGNCLMDLVIQKRTRNKKSFDQNGKIARQGKINDQAIRTMISHPYFRQEPPKSTGREIFNESFIPKSLFQDNLQNLLATLNYFTALSIAESYRRFIPHRIDRVYVSGGGALNTTLMQHLKELLAPAQVKTFDTLGIPSQAKEPMAFAYFAWLAIQNKINHLPEVTGAKQACVLGKIIANA